jgi:hypothetical protein
MQACLDEEIDGLAEVGFMDNRVILDLFFAGAGIFPLLKEQTEFDQGSVCLSVTVSSTSIPSLSQGLTKP